VRRDDSSGIKIEVTEQAGIVGFTHGRL
jgi:hypothetical protein